MSCLNKLLGNKEEVQPAPKPPANAKGSNFPPYTFSPRTADIPRVVNEQEKRQLIDVELQELKGLYLIVRHPTGVEYTHQCAGLSCAHLSLEGYLVPLEQTDRAEDELAQYFISGHSYSGLEWQEITEIEAIFKRHGLDWLCIAPNRLKDSYEAWIHVCIKPEYTWVPFCSRSDPRAEIVLVWQNSD